MKSSTKGVIFLALLVLSFLIIAGIFMFSGQPDPIKYNEALELIVEGDIKHVYVEGFQAKAKKTQTSSKYDYVFNIPSRADFANDVIREFNAKYGDGDNQITSLLQIAEEFDFAIEFNDPNAGSIWQYLPYLLGVVMLVLLAFFVYRMLNQGNKQAISFSKSKARLNQNVKVRFSDVAGAEEEKTELAEIVEFLKNPKKFEQVGARIPKGVLLVGPPGTGKTLFAKAVAGEANVPFFSISGSDFVEMFVGVGASRVRDLFEDAKKNIPCIVFIDEIDAVGRQRGTGLGGGHDEREQTLNQLLVQMDGFETNSGIIVMAATNRADILDPALLRPGRFDRQIYINIPDVRGREEIFKVHARNKPIGSDVDFKVLARITSGFSGADIENLLNEAAILAARAGRKVINMLDINEGINKVIMGPQKKSRVITEVDKRITAYHEAGHAIVAKILPHCDPVHEVSIIPRGRAAGYTMTRPETDDTHTTFNKLNDEIAMLMGGRAAEELVIKDISTGAISDLQVATERARKMVTEWGMSQELGPIYLGSKHELFLGRDYQSTHNYSEKVAALIDAEIKKILERGYQTALKVLNEHREVMDKMVRLLIEKETIYSEEVDALMAGKPLDEIERELEERLQLRAKQASEAISRPVRSEGLSS
ncbi:MAG: ATP-dependent metallopeptidase FtsH/Yme1/Tma family protein [Clostridiales bacterium]|nr:ATP-dependent metallopeptidase FtsH/Yme1/Tma family protein [Clostridiales bacterium]